MPEETTIGLRDFAIVPAIHDQLEALDAMAEKEDWNYKNTPTAYQRPILYNYIQRTFSRVHEQNKIASTPDNEHACWNTGLVTEHQEPIYVLLDQNLKRGQEGQPPWHFRRFCRRGEFELNYFAQLPEMASYFDDPSCLVFDCRRELRVNIEHIIEDNKDRFPDPYRARGNYELQMILQGAVTNAQERVRRNYKAAVPQYYHGKVQLLLPLCLSGPDKADLAMVAERFDTFYRASTCLTLDMAYNNARQLAKPDRDWLQP